MTIILHELSFQGDVRPSPYCWRVRLALEHKGLDYDTLPAAFSDIPKAAGGGHKTVPILEDRSRGKEMADSWTIANYLDEAHPAPPLFGNGGRDGPGWAYAAMLHNWMQPALHVPALKVILLDIYDRIKPEDRGYFLESREKRLGTTIEAFTEGAAEEKIAAVRKALEPLRAVVRERPFLSGAAPFYADYIGAGFFFWWRAVSPTRLLLPDDPLTPWFERILARFPRAVQGSAKVWQGP